MTSELDKPVTFADLLAVIENAEKSLFSGYVDHDQEVAGRSLSALANALRAYAIGETR
jgi:hypothetical protein